MAVSKTITRSRLLSLLCLVYGLIITSSVNADDHLRSAILACAGETEDLKKLNCYNAIADGIEQPAADMDVASTTDIDDKKAPVETETANDTNSEANEISEMDAGMGGGEFAAKAGVKPKLSRGRVTSCKKSADRRWFFIFENGQVWKQVNNRRRRFRDCDFDVLISEDAFGYKMLIEEKDTSIRISRIR